MALILLQMKDMERDGGSNNRENPEALI